MRLRSHTARKHFPQLPDEVWSIVMDTIMNDSDDIEQNFLIWTKLRPTCKAFYQRCTFHSHELALQSSCVFTAHRIFKNVSIRTSQLRFLTLKDCIFHHRDQFAFTSCTWHLKGLYIQTCGFEDYYLGLLLSRLTIQPGMDIFIADVFGPFCGFHLAHLLQRFHRQKEDARLKVRWQSLHKDMSQHLKAERYVLGALHELKDETHGTPQTEVTIRSLIDIASCVRSIHSNYLWDRGPHAGWTDAQGIQHQCSLYNLHCSSITTPLHILPPPIPPPPNVSLILKQETDSRRRMSSRLMLQSSARM